MQIMGSFLCNQVDVVRKRISLSITNSNIENIEKTPHLFVDVCWCALYWFNWVCGTSCTRIFWYVIDHFYHPMSVSWHCDFIKKDGESWRDSGIFSVHVDDQDYRGGAYEWKLDDAAERTIPTILAFRTIVWAEFMLSMFHLLLISC